MRLHQVGLGVLLAVAGFVAEGRAALLNLVTGNPDIASQFITVDYNAGTQLLTASGTALALDFDGIAPPDYALTNGAFTLSATVGPGGVATGGSLVISATALVESLPNPPRADTGVLLSGTLSQFGFQDPPGGTLFEFVFNVTGGTLAAEYGPLAGVKLNAGSPNFNGLFTSNYNGDFLAGVADTFAVPEPGTGALLAGAAAGLMGLRRRRA